MNKNIITGIDIGTNTIKIVVSEVLSNGSVKILGVGTSKSEGLRNGYIVDLPSTITSVSKALDNTVKTARLRPNRAFLSIGGISLSGMTANGTAYIRHSDSTIYEQDFEKSIDDASQKSKDKLINKKVIHDIPIRNFVDGEEALCNPVGMQGSKLDSTVMLVHALESHIDDFVSAVEDAGVEVVDVTAGPLAASFASVSTPQKMQGCILLDIGSESTDVIIFENNTPITLRVLPIGSNDITNAIAVGLKVSPSEAERIKKGSLIGAKYTQASIDKIISKSLNELFTEIKSIIKELDNNTILPSGVLITGGGARLASIEDIAKKALKLPTKIVYAKDKHIAGNPEFTVAYGLCIWGANNDTHDTTFNSIKKVIKKISSWVKQFLP